MKSNIDELLNFVREKKHHKFRKKVEYTDITYFQKNNIPDVERVTFRFKEFLKKETPIILPNQNIVFMRQLVTSPIYTLLMN